MSTNNLSHTTNPCFVLNNNNLPQPSAGAVAEIALPSTITNINATTVNDTLNSAASAAFSDPPPEPVDYSPVTQLTVGEWAVVGTVFLMLVLVMAVILWQVWVRRRRRRMVRAAALRGLNGVEREQQEEEGEGSGKTRGVGWEVMADRDGNGDGDGDGDGDVRALADGNWRGGAERYAYRLSHAVELIQHK